MLVASHLAALAEPVGHGDAVLGSHGAGRVACRAVHTAAGAPPSGLDARHRDVDRSTRGDEHRHIEGAVLLGAEQRLAVEQQQRGRRVVDHRQHGNRRTALALVDLQEPTGSGFGTAEVRRRRRQLVEEWEEGERPPHQRVAELGLKRNDLRDRSSLSYPYIAELEHGTKRPSQAALAAIAEALELRPSELLERAERLAEGATSDELRGPVAPGAYRRAWFREEQAPMALRMEPSSMASAPIGTFEFADMALASPLRRPPRAGAIAPALRDAIEDIVRRVVREELERAGLTEPGRPSRPRRPPRRD